MKRYMFNSFLLACVLAVSICFAELVFSQQEESLKILGEERLRSAIKVQKNNESALLAMPGVIAVGVGMDENGGEPAVHVYLNTASLAASLSRSAMPRKLNGITVRIIETGPIRAFDGPPGTDHRLPYPAPVPMGTSTSNFNGIFAGTLGVRVFRAGQSGLVGYITNNHVASPSGAGLCPAQLNPARVPAFGVDQCQPGRLDAAGNVCRNPRVGDLIQAVPIIMGGAFENTVDVAFVGSTRSLVNKTILDIGNPSPTVQNAAVNLAVRKSGRTTGFTTGTIQTINATVNVGYGGSCGTAKFVGQIIIVGSSGSFSAAGDSGSLILGGTDSSGRRRPVGLLFAGSDIITVANRIGDVLGALGVQIDTQ